MDHPSTQALARLGLLLAGAGNRCRRLVGEVGGRRGDLLDAVAGLGAPEAVLAAARTLAREEAGRVIESATSDGWRWVVPGDDSFPSPLLSVVDPPLGLFVRGELLPGPVVAVVGSRKATAYGRQVAAALAGELACAGVQVCSGMARGVDAAAHQAALAAGGRTVAVWGTGPGVVYPPEHRTLAEAIARSGANVSEYPPGTPPRRHHFPERNRILAGLSHAVVVVEAGPRSGALITARLALDEGREVLAVPGSIFSEQSVGPNALLRLGARPMLAPRDVFEAIGLDPAPARPREASTGGGEKRRLVEAGEAVTVDEIATRHGLEVQEALSLLLERELEGEVERLPDGRYAMRVRGRNV